MGAQPRWTDACCQREVKAQSGELRFVPDPLSDRFRARFCLGFRSRRSEPVTERLCGARSGTATRVDAFAGRRRGRQPLDRHRGPGTDSGPERRQITLDASSGLPDNNVNAVLPDREQNVWVGCEDGLVRFSKSSVANVGTLDGLDDNDVLTIYQDRIGDLWLTTVTGQVYRVSGNVVRRFRLPAPPRPHRPHRFSG